MATDAQRPVVILYKHPLLGEGIARYLRAQIDVGATLACMLDPSAVGSALALDPAVVIFESNDPSQRFDLGALVPHAVLIDVSTVIARGTVSTPRVVRLEQILQAVRESSDAVAAPHHEAGP